MEHIKSGLNPKDDCCILRIEQVAAIFVGQGTTKSHHQESLNLIFVNFGPNFLLVITIIGFKITFDNMEYHGTPPFISGGWSESETSPLTGLKTVYLLLSHLYYY